MSLDTPRRKLERLQSLDSPETTIMKKQRSDAELRRSLTVSERRVSGSPAVHKYGGRTSPLKRFGLAKESIFRAYGLIKDRLVEVQDFLVTAHGEDGEGRIVSLLEKTKGIEDILTRDHMKVVFFGRTSNGKSTVINALLRDKVLPSGIGHTTNCFCSVVGVEDERGYILTPGSEEHRDIKTLQQLAHSLYKDRLSTSSLIRVFWPQEKCPLLQEDVEFVDSPGVDMNPDVDDWINTHCLDADVFVLIANSESTLMNAEKNFFHHVSERLSRPNIFILNNRWDASAQEPELMEEVRQQHLENNVDFLTKHLNVVDELTAKERVYFVSAKEVLTLRMRQQNNEENIGQGLADGHKARLVEFERFEFKFKQCLSSSAISTKFEQHHTRGTEIVSELQQLLESEELFVQEKSKLLQDELRQTWSEKQEMTELNNVVHSRATRIVEETDDIVKERVADSMKIVLHELHDCVMNFDHSDGFDLGQLDSYEKALYQHIDSHLKTQLSHLCVSTLADPHQKACDDIVTLFQKLPQHTLSKHVPKIDPPNVNFKISSADLCRDFKENLEFSFSLSLPSLMKLAGKLNIGAIFINLHRCIENITAGIPSEIIFPLTLVAGGFALSCLMSWRYLVLPTAIYCGVYVFQKFTWTEAKKERKLKEQIYSFLEERLDPHTLAIQNSYSSVLLSDLQRLYGALTNALSLTEGDLDNKISELGKEYQKMEQLQGQVHKLRNSVCLLKRDLEDFKEEYLADID